MKSLRYVVDTQVFPLDYLPFISYFSGNHSQSMIVISWQDNRRNSAMDSRYYDGTKASENGYDQWLWYSSMHGSGTARAEDWVILRGTERVMSIIAEYRIREVMRCSFFFGYIQQGQLCSYELRVITILVFAFIIENNYVFFSLFFSKASAC